MEDETIRNLIAEKSGVPAEVLRGDTIEEMTAHAEALSAYLAPPSAPFVESDGRASAFKEPPPKDWLSEAFQARRRGF